MGLSTPTLVKYSDSKDFILATGDRRDSARDRRDSARDRISNTTSGTKGLWLSNIFAGNNSYDMPNSGKEDKKPKDWGAIFQTKRDSASGTKGLNAVKSGVGAGIFGSVISTVRDIWSGKQQKDILEQQQQLAQQQMIANLTANRKKDIMPVVIVGSVLLIGGAIVVLSMTKK